MKCTPEFLEVLKTAVESVEYGSVEITLAEKGSFIEIIVKNKYRLEKEEPLYLPFKL